LRKIQKDAGHNIPFPEDGLVYDYRYKLLNLIMYENTDTNEEQVKITYNLRTHVTKYLLLLGDYLFKKLRLNVEEINTLNSK